MSWIGRLCGESLQTFPEHDQSGIHDHQFHPRLINRAVNPSSPPFKRARLSDPGGEDTHFSARSYIINRIYKTMGNEKPKGDDPLAGLSKRAM